MPSERKESVDTYSSAWHQRQTQIASKSWSFDGLNGRHIAITADGRAKLSFFGHIALDEVRSRKGGHYRATMGRFTSGSIPLPRALEARIKARHAQSVMELKASELLHRVNAINANLKKAA